LSSRLLQVSDYHCEREDRSLFRDVNFTLDSGEIMQVVGHNGCGKTTLLRSLAGLSNFASGNVEWRGLSREENITLFRQEVLFHGHLPAVKHLLTPLENLRWFTATYCSADDAAILTALEAVGLFGYEDIPAGKLSAGQLRRVALARLLLSDAKLWVLDEPFTAIDVHGIEMLQKLLQQHLDKGGAVLLTSHQSVDVAQIKSLNLEHYR